MTAGPRHVVRPRRARLLQHVPAVATATSVTATFTTAQATVGNLLVCRLEASTIGTNITGPAGFTKIIGVDYGSSAGHAAIWAKPAAGGETAATVARSASGHIGVHLAEYEHVSATVDKTVTADSGASTVTSLAIGPTATTTTADELLVVIVATAGTQGAVTPFTNYFGTKYAVSNNRMMVADLVVAETGAWSTTAAWVTAQKAGAVMASFPVV